MATIDDVRTENLKALIKQYGGVVNFSKIVGKNRAQVSQWANNTPTADGKPRYITSKMCRQLEGILELDNEWMDVNRLECIEVPKVCVKAVADEVSFDMLDVSAACSTNGGSVNPDYPEVVRRIVMPVGRAMELIGSLNKHGQIKVIMAARDSMTPTINPNDLLFVDTSINDYRGEAIYILSLDGELVCKRLQRQGKHIVVSSDNRNYAPWNWEDKPDDTFIIGRVLRALPMDFKNFGN